MAEIATPHPTDAGNYASLVVERRETFRRFLAGVLLVVTQILQTIALLTTAWAVGAGWWAGLALFIAIGAAVGLASRRSAIYWAVQVIEWAALTGGGLIFGALSH